MIDPTENLEADDKPSLYCSFCGKSQQEVVKLIAGPSVFICDECVDLCNDIIREETTKFSDSTTNLASTAQELLQATDNAIPRQHHAKKILCAAIFEHFSRDNSPTFPAPPSAILIAGPTGSGKSELISSMTHHLGLPLETINVPLLFPESPFKEQLEFTGFDNNPGVVLLKNIDCAVATGVTDDTSKRIQESIISLLDGAIGQFSGQENRNTVDTSRILFIATASFPDQLIPNEISISRDFLTRYGLLPELVARFGELIKLTELCIDDLIELLNRDNGIITQYQHRFRKGGLSIEFSSDAIEQIAVFGKKRGGGIRGLYSVMDSISLALAFHTPSGNNGKITIDQQLVLDNVE